MRCVPTLLVIAGLFVASSFAEPPVEPPRSVKADPLVTRLEECQKERDVRKVENAELKRVNTELQAELQ